jgi:hypothetical protein
MNVLIPLNQSGMSSGVWGLKSLAWRPSTRVNSLVDNLASAKLGVGRITDFVMFNDCFRIETWMSKKLLSVKLGLYEIGTALLKSEVMNQQAEDLEYQCRSENLVTTFESEFTYCDTKLDPSKFEWKPTNLNCTTLRSDEGKFTKR